MAVPRITQEVKRHAVTFSLVAGRSDSEIVIFLNLPRSFVFKLRRVLDAPQWRCGNRFLPETTLPTLRHFKDTGIHQYCPSCNRRAPWKIHKGTELHADEAIIHRVVHEDSRHKSYVMPKVRLMSRQPEETE